MRCIWLVIKNKLEMMWVRSGTLCEKYLVANKEWQ